MKKTKKNKTPTSGELTRRVPTQLLEQILKPMKPTIPTAGESASLDTQFLQDALFGNLQHEFNILDPSTLPEFQNTLLSITDTIEATVKRRDPLAEILNVPKTREKNRIPNFIPWPTSEPTPTVPNTPTTTQDVLEYIEIATRGDWIHLAEVLEATVERRKKKREPPNEECTEIENPLRERLGLPLTKCSEGGVQTVNVLAGRHSNRQTNGILRTKKTKRRNGLMRQIRRR